MKTKISKRDVMKRAWNIFKMNFTYYVKMTWSECLKRAWSVEKAYALAGESTWLPINPKFLNLGD